MSRALTAAYAQAHASPILLTDGLREPLRVTGEDRARFLHGMLSNDIAGLEVGHGCHAAWLTAKGKVLADLGVAVAPEAIWLLCPSGERGAVAAGLERFIIADDVELDLPPVALLGVVGPGTREGLGLPDLVPWGVGEARVGEATFPAFAWPETGLEAALILCPREALGRTRELLDAVGLGTEPVENGDRGLELLELLRIEAGVPRFGVDFGAETLVLEAGLDDCISYTKGCYVGQEVVARQRSRGRLSHLLRGLIMDGEVVPDPGSSVSSEAKTEAGVVTSAVRSLALERPVAMATLHRAVAAPGTKVTVGESLAATVVDLPFVSRR